MTGARVSPRIAPSMIRRVLLTRRRAKVSRCGPWRASRPRTRTTQLNRRDGFGENFMSVSGNGKVSDLEVVPRAGRIGAEVIGVRLSGDLYSPDVRAIRQTLFK